MRKLLPRCAYLPAVPHRPSGQPRSHLSGGLHSATLGGRNAAGRRDLTTPISLLLPVRLYSVYLRRNVVIQNLSHSFGGAAVGIHFRAVESSRYSWLRLRDSGGSARGKEPLIQTAPGPGLVPVSHFRKLRPLAARGISMLSYSHFPRKLNVPLAQIMAFGLAFTSVKEFSRVLALAFIWNQGRLPLSRCNASLVG